MNGIKGVFFDLYGTLLVYGDMDRAWEDWFEALYERFVNYGLTESRGDLSNHLKGFFAKPYPAGTGGLSILEMRLLRLGEEVGLSLSGDQVSTVAHAAVSAWQAHVSVDPDARRVLETLGESRKIALISNFDHPIHAHNVLRDSGLSDCFESITFSGEVGVKKPDPGIFQIALTNLSLEPGECVYVGDTEEDVQGAWAAGIPAIVIDRSSGEVGPMLDFGVAGTALPDAGQHGLPDRRWIRDLTELIPIVADQCESGW